MLIGTQKRIEYLEARLASAENRVAFWHEECNKMMKERLDKLQIGPQPETPPYVVAKKVRVVNTAAVELHFGAVKPIKLSPAEARELRNDLNRLLTDIQPIR